jgi:hypothetical protein
MWAGPEFKAALDLFTSERRITFKDLVSPGGKKGSKETNKSKCCCLRPSLTFGGCGFREATERKTHNIYDALLSFTVHIMGTSLVQKMKE